MNPRIAAGIPLILAGGLALAGCASNLQVTPMGNDTYAITRRAVTAFARDTAELKAEVKDDAADYCSARGKQMKVVELTAEKPRLAAGFATARIVFQAVEAAPAPARVARPADRVDALYSDLVKLDTLRQKNILTNEEFQAEKKKVLDRSP